MQRKLGLIFLLVTCWHSIAAAATDAGPMSAQGGQLVVTFYRGNLRDVGLTVNGTRPLNFQHDIAAITISQNSSLSFHTHQGFFKELAGGQLNLDAGLTISAAGLQIVSEHLDLEPRATSQAALQLTGAQGEDWFYLDYGHYERDGQWLFARFLDVRIGRDLAARLGDPSLFGFMLGSAMLKTQVNLPLVADSEAAPGITPGCPVLDPNWPTLPEFDADIAMLRLDSVNQVARESGRVAIAPSAYFENIGTADVPWFAQFADTRNVDACCADQGDGACAPYGNDQGGMLVYHLYRFVDERLEQLGQSQVKHAFNSINADTTSGSVSCRAPNRSGRVVPSGCEDLYQVSSNSDQAFLGPREEIIAHTGIWLRDGSIWDLDGPLNEPDGNCDYLPDLQLFGGQVPCQAPVSDAMDRRLSVPESELSTPGARYFIEAWYLVRDDVNIFNSIGRKEITPAFSGGWTFAAAAPFKQGPVINDFLELQNATTNGMTDIVDSGEGFIQVSSAVSIIAPDRWQYDITLMNFDFDRAISGFEIPVSLAVTVSEAEFFDGDPDIENNWLATIQPGLLKFEAGDSDKLKWGSLVSFRFVADAPPNVARAALHVADPGEPGSLDINMLTSSTLLFDDGFE